MAEFYPFQFHYPEIQGKFGLFFWLQRRKKKKSIINMYKKNTSRTLYKALRFEIVLAN